VQRARVVVVAVTLSVVEPSDVESPPASPGPEVALPLLVELDALRSLLAVLPVAVPMSDVAFDALCERVLSEL
jgi:hypothetical protein